MVKDFAEASMSADADAVCGAGHGERSPERVNRRNGYRERDWDTRVGSIERAVPKPGLQAGEWPRRDRRGLPHPPAGWGALRVCDARCAGGEVPRGRPHRQQLLARFPEAAEPLDEAGPDLLAFTGFPKEHSRYVPRLSNGSPARVQSLLPPG